MPDQWAVALRAERRRQGMTQQEFALLIGYAGHASAVAHIEAGRAATSHRARARIEAALGNRLAAREVDMSDTEQEGERVKAEMVEKIDAEIARQREVNPGKSIEDFDGDVEAFLRYLGSGSDER